MVKDDLLLTKRSNHDEAGSEDGYIIFMNEPL